MQFTTLAVHGDGSPAESTGDVVSAIHLATTYRQPKLGEFQEYVYTRGTNPTRLALEKRLALLEDARYAFAFSSGMVFQNFQLFPHKTVLENIMEGPVLVKKEEPRDVRTFALALLEKVEMSDKKDSYPATLSGGQQQRVAIARALGMRPDVLLFDEPTSALDPELEREVLKVIRTLVEENNTMIIVTHNLLFAREVADFIAFLDNGEVTAYGTPKEIFGKAMPKRVSDFITAMSPEDYTI